MLDISFGSAVIHQPRKQIYDMFDSLILLGVGGNVVYQGNTWLAEGYFQELGYAMGVGEGEADWLIDIASGELVPTLSMEEASLSQLEVKDGNDNEIEVLSDPLLQQGRENGASAADYRNRLYKAWLKHYASLEGVEKEFFSKAAPTALPQSKECPSFLSQVKCQLGRQAILARRNVLSKLLETMLLIVATVVIALVNKPLQFTEDIQPNIPSEYYVLTSIQENPENFEAVLPFIFKHALENANNVVKYGSEVSIVLAVLVSK